MRLSLVTIVVLAALASIAAAQTTYNILNYGAVPEKNTIEAALANVQAVEKAAADANTQGDYSIVLIPSGNFFFFRVNLTNLQQVTIQVDGSWILSNNISYWQNVIGGGVAKVFASSASLVISYSNGIKLIGKGIIDGQGYDWWKQCLTPPKYVDNRPSLVRIEHSYNIETTLSLKNAPQYHYVFYDDDNVYMHDFTITVDTVAQKNYITGSGGWSITQGIPLYPLNTDGIDVAATNVLIENFSITSYDDAIAVKPCQQNSTKMIVCKCAADMTIRNGKVYHGTGLTIGTVSPRKEINCVRNVTFDTISVSSPFKGIYIKTNPGTVGSGQISNVVFNNIKITNPSWYPIYVGPQQQKQPGGGADTGCSFLYPVVKTCPTQPLVSINQITFSNIKITGALTLPGVINCDPANPCTNIVFDNVSNKPVITWPYSIWPVSSQYTCNNVQGRQRNTSPKLKCLGNF